MIVRLARRLFVLTLLLFCSFPPAACAQTPARPAASDGTPVRILFIGNSYTYFNNLPDLVQTLAAGMQPARRVEFTRVLVGGATLMSHWNKGDALKALRGSRWDFVFLQEQSTLGTTIVNGELTITDPNRYFWPYVREFDREIKKAGAKTVLLATWARRNQPQNFDALTHAYMTIGRELQALVVPAGSAWQRALKEQADLPLYVDDGSHPAPAGSYLTALIVLSALFDAEPPASLPLRIEGHATNDDGQATEKIETIASIDRPTFDRFRRIAWSTWRDAKAAGGYLDVKAGASATVAPLGEGLALAPGALAGTWRGTLRLFMLPDGAKAPPLRLVLTPQGDGYTGTIGPVVGTDGGRDQARSDITITGRQITFSAPSGQPGGPRVRYTAVLSSATALSGHAEVTLAEMAVRMLGTWTATRD